MNAEPLQPLRNAPTRASTRIVPAGDHMRIACAEAASSAIPSAIARLLNHPCLLLRATLSPRPVCRERRLAEPKRVERSVGELLAHSRRLRVADLALARGDGRRKAHDDDSLVHRRSYCEADGGWRLERLVCNAPDRRSTSALAEGFVRRAALSGAAQYGGAAVLAKRCLARGVTRGSVWKASPTRSQGTDRP
jgi:hypothetical protein